MRVPSRLWDMTKLLVSTALGHEKADMVIKQADLVNVYSGELLEEVDVAIKGDRIALVGKANHCIGGDTLVLEARGKYLVPGLLDGHVHVESSMLTVTEFARAVLPRGTIGIFMDPHEIANVLGVEGIKLMINEARGLPLRVFICVPSCVPACPGLETAGAEIGPEEVKEMLGLEEVVGLAEMMNYPGVLSCDQEVHNKIRFALEARKLVEGHSNGLLDEELAAYVAAGISSCHESTRKIEGLQRVRLGMYAMIREGSAWKDLAEVIKVVTEERVNAQQVILVTDDRHPRDLLVEGHMDHVVRRTIEEGVDPIVALQMATLNTARHYKVDVDVGGIAPSKYADILILDDLSKFLIDTVIAGGVIVAKGGRLVVDLKASRYPEHAKRTVRVKRPLVPQDFMVKSPLKEGKAKAHVIEIVEGKVTTKHIIEELIVEGGVVQPSVEGDIAKVAVVERHKLTGNIGLGFVKGFGFTEGAVASTVAHDSHNLLVVGMSDEDMAFAANEIVRVGGGMIAVRKRSTIGLIKLPIAGLISEKSAEVASEEVERLENAWTTLGCKIRSPFMTMSLLALPVLPELRITDKGLIDTVKFERIEPTIHFALE